MEAHQLRVVAERDELAERLSKLETFNQSSVFWGLPYEDRDLLYQQANHMTGYLQVLDARLQRWKPQST